MNGVLISIFFFLNMLVISNTPTYIVDQTGKQWEATHRPCKDTALRYIGTRENLGNNDSKMIRIWDKVAKVPVGKAYCSSFVSWVLEVCNVTYPTIRTGWAKNFVTNRSVSAINVYKGIAEVPGDAIAVFTRDGGGHVGIVFDWKGIKGRIIEANTAPEKSSGSQWNGDGVWMKNRTIERYNHFRIINFTPIIYEN